MENVEYLVLAYARSERSIEVTDILLLSRLPEGIRPRLRALLREDYNDVMADATDSAVEYVGSILLEIRKQLISPTNAEDNGFFEAMESLNIGPLRTSFIGSLPLESPLYSRLVDGHVSDQIQSVPDGELTSLVECLRKNEVL